MKPLPMDIQLKMMYYPYDNYKTVRCKYFDEEGVCKFGKNCTFAHGDLELRGLYDPILES